MQWRRAQFMWLGYLKDFLDKVEPEVTGICKMSKSEMNVSVADKEQAGGKNNSQKEKRDEEC